MSRDLTAALLAEITAVSLRPVLFYEGEFTGGTLRLWSGLASISWNSQTWLGAGNLLAISEIEETSEIRAAGVTVALSGLNTSIISAALAQARQGLAGRVWIGGLGRAGYLDLPGVADNYASTPDSAAFAFTTAFEVVAKIAANDYTPSSFMRIACQDTSLAGASSWRFIHATTGELLIQVSDGANYLGATSTVTLGSVVADGADVWVKANLLFDDGAGNRVGKFYYSSDRVTWTQLGATVTTAGTLTMNITAIECAIGATSGGNVGPYYGTIHYVEIRNGIDGTVVACFDPSTDARAKDKSFTSSATGEVWTIQQSGGTPAELVVEDAVVIADPFLAFEGRLDVPDISDDGESCTVRVSYESRLIDLERPRERRITHEDQQIDYPGDLGREYVASLQDKVVVW